MKIHTFGLLGIFSNLSHFEVLLKQVRHQIMGTDDEKLILTPVILSKQLFHNVGIIFSIE